MLIIVLIAMIRELIDMFAVAGSLALAGLLEVVFGALSAIMRTGIVALAVWATAVFLFKRTGVLPATFRLVGFANVAFAPLMLVHWAVGAVNWVLFIASLIWFFLALRVVTGSQFDFEHPEDSFVAVVGAVAWFLLYSFRL